MIDANKVRWLLIGVSLIALLGLAACGDPQQTPVVPAATATATSGPPDSADTATPTTGGGQAATPVAQPTETAAPAPTDPAPPGPTVTPIILPTVTPAAEPTETTAPAPTDTAVPAPTDTAAPAPAPTNTAVPAPTDTAAPAPAPTDTVLPAPTTPAAGRPEWRRVATGGFEGLANARGGAVYAAGQGVSRSTDGGATWTALTTAFEAGFVAVAPSDPRVIYAGTGEGCFSGFEGTLYRSGDGGATWTEVTGGPFSLDINPTDPNRLLALNCGNVVRSTDGGRTWTDLPGTIAPNYTPAILARGVNDRATIYAVFASEGGSIQILRTTDDARTWQTLTTPDFYGPHDFVVDPLDAKHVYLVAGSGFYASANGGNSWNRLSNGLEPADSDLGNFLQLTSLALDRVSPPPARNATATLYVGSYGSDPVPPAGVFRWNGIDRWVAAAPAPDGQNITALLATTAPQQPALLAATEQGIYRWPLTLGGQ